MMLHGYTAISSMWAEHMYSSTWPPLCMLYSSSGRIQERVCHIRDTQNRHTWVYREKTKFAEPGLYFSGLTEHPLFCFSKVPISWDTGTMGISICPTYPVYHVQGIWVQNTYTGTHIGVCRMPMYQMDTILGPKNTVLRNGPKWES